MDYYKDITKLPFRDFTLDEFDSWALAMENIKNSSVHANFKELLQATYYQLAIYNYHGALYFLKKCEEICDKNQPENQKNQIIFLPILLYQDEPRWCKKHAKIPDSSSKHFKRDLLKLCLAKYRPALILIGKTKNRFFKYNLDASCFVYWFCRETTYCLADVLHILEKIEICMVETKVDDYYICKFRIRINSIRKLINKESFNGYGSETIDNDDMSIMLPLMLQGSNKALSRVLKCCITYHIRGPYRIRGADDQTNEFFRQKTLDNQKLIDHHYNDIKRLLLLKMDCMDVYLSTSLLKKFSHLGCVYIGTLTSGNQSVLLKTVVDAVHQYLILSGKNVAIGVAYLNFWRLLKFESFVPTCRSTLLTYLTHGLVFLPMYYPNNLITTIYEMMPFDDEFSSDVIKKHVQNVNSLVENCFWYSRDDDEQEKMDFLKSDSFSFLIKLNNLWEPALVVLGISINKESFFWNKSEPYTFSTSVKQLHFGIFLHPLFTILIKDLLLNLSDIKAKYFDLFGKEIDNDYHFRLKEDSQNAINDANKYSFLPIIYDICKFSIEYVHYINLHEQYKPDGSEYLSIKNSFDNSCKR